MNTNQNIGDSEIEIIMWGWSVDSGYNQSVWAEVSSATSRQKGGAAVFIVKTDSDGHTLVVGPCGMTLGQAQQAYDAEARDWAMSDAHYRAEGEGN